MTNAEELTGRQLFALRIATVVHGAALLWVSPWLRPMECAALAMGVAVSSEIRLASRKGTLSAKLAWALAVAALSAALAGRAPFSSQLVMFDLTTFAFMAVAHAPALIVRHRELARSTEAAPEVAEMLGASMVATALALTVQSRARTWSIAQGTTWTTGLCFVLGVAAVVWAWLCWSRRRAWNLPTTTEQASGEMVTGGVEAPYRATRLHKPIARADRGWWRRRLLVAVALLWTFAVVNRGASSVLDVRPESERGRVTRAMHAVLLGNDPCRVGRGPQGRRDFGDDGSQATFVRGRHGSVWASGAFYVVAGRSTMFEDPQLRSGCSSAQLARRWIERSERDEERDRVLLQRIVEPAPDDPDYRVESPPPCAPRRWCSVGWQSHSVGPRGDGDYGARWDACTLWINGRFQFGDVYERSGRVPAARARALIEAIEQAAGILGWSYLTSDPSPSFSDTGHLDRAEFLVRIGGVGLRRVEFPHARAIGEALSRQLCERLPPHAEHLPETHVVLPDDL